MSDANMMQDAARMAEAMINKYGQKEAYRQARKCLSDAETRLSQCYWLRICLALEETAND